MSAAGREEHPTACSLQIGIELGTRKPASDIRNRMDAFLAGVTDFLRDNGCTLIGHIKGLLDAGESGQLFFSITSFDEEVRYKGAIDGGISAAVLSINVIVYGIEEEPVASAVRQQLEQHFTEHPEE